MQGRAFLKRCACALGGGIAGVRSMAGLTARLAVDDGREAAHGSLLLARWLWFVAGLVISIVVVGGITRLTESGVSITEWKPVTGAIPPLTEAQWQAEFEAYRRTPQYIEINGPAGI